MTNLECIKVTRIIDNEPNELQSIIDDATDDQYILNIFDYLYSEYEEYYELGIINSRAIEEYERAVEELEADINTYQEENTLLETTIDDLESQNKDLENTVADLKSKITELEREGLSNGE